MVAKKRILALVFCREGPYKHALSLLKNSEVSWVPWSYHESHIASDLLENLRKGIRLNGWEVVFICGSINHRSNAQLIRKGTIDYWSFSHDTLRLTVFLGETIDGQVELPPSRSLCYYRSQNPDKQMEKAKH